MSQEVWDLERFASRVAGGGEPPHIPAQATYAGRHLSPGGEVAAAAVEEVAVEGHVQVAEPFVSGPPLLVKVLAGVVSFGAGLALAIGAAGGLG